MVLITVITAIFISAILYTSKKILANNFDDFIANNKKEHQNLNQKIDQLNNLAHFLKVVRDEHIDWATVLFAITSQTTSDITLISLQINNNEKMVLLQGFSPNRDGLLEFKANLESLPVLEEVDLPIQNIAQKENINFTISAKLRLNKITN